MCKLCYLLVSLVDRVDQEVLDGRDCVTFVDLSV